MLTSFAVACICGVPVVQPAAASAGGRALPIRPFALADSAATPRPLMRTGCAEFLIRITGAKDVVVATPVGQQCGSVEPTLLGSPQFDAVRREIRLSFALRNGGMLQLHAPAAMTARRGSLQVPLRPLGVTGLRFVTADSGAGDSTSATGTRWWSFDRLLRSGGGQVMVAEDGEFVVPPTALSAPRTLVVAIPPDLTAFQLTLMAVGTTVFTIPGEPPSRVSREEREDSHSSTNLVIGDPRFPGRVVRNKLWLLFRRDATVEQRQATVDAVQGVVIGGQSIGGSRYYYIRIPANPDSGGAPLERAIRKLAPLPQVQHVMPDRPDLVPGS